ncbi:hypothetical protein NC653_028421 [Populus alba x Populus x berolinensis]|uniref:Uncharacterized protein n=1 Tax=Populus alba x Populus x berolinensis TaxID=444605 RepID=A0AAD6M8V9_9ROSI|nr:hypothetical protein NC653_028421 [Populus alba x Populus x berolinensis]
MTGQAMASVVWMLRGDSALPNPKEPAFLTDRGPLESSSSSTRLYYLQPMKKRSTVSSL